jgi:hypothetical protein
VVSQLKVNEIIKQSGSSITIGEDGDTVSGPFTNTPMFHVYLNAHQTASNNAFTKFQGDIVVKDTDSAYSTSDYRWTCPSGKSGTYLFWWRLFIHYSGNTISLSNAILKKNGSTITGTDNGDGVGANDGSLLKVPINGTFVVDVSDGDYIELFGFATTSNSGDYLFISKSCGWGGMKLTGA